MRIRSNGVVDIEKLSPNRVAGLRCHRRHLHGPVDDYVLPKIVAGHVESGPRIAAEVGCLGTRLGNRDERSFAVPVIDDVRGLWPPIRAESHEHCLAVRAEKWRSLRDIHGPKLATLQRYTDQARCITTHATIAVTASIMAGISILLRATSSVAPRAPTGRPRSSWRRPAACSATHTAATRHVTRCSTISLASNRSTLLYRSSWPSILSRTQD